VLAARCAAAWLGYSAHVEADALLGELAKTANATTTQGTEPRANDSIQRLTRDWALAGFVIRRHVTSPHTYQPTEMTAAR
jgi:hypothetical protein